MPGQSAAPCLESDRRAITIGGEKAARSRAARRGQAPTVTEDTLQGWFGFYNGTIFDGKLHSVRIRWSSKLLTTAGKTKYYRLAHRCDIDLNARMLDTEPKIRNTLVHELCHAAVFMIDGDTLDGHGPRWRTWVALATETHKELAINVYHHYRANYGFYYVCSASHGRCQIAYGSFRAQAAGSLQKYRCRQCQAPLRHAPGSGVPAHLHVAHIQRAKRAANSQIDPSAPYSAGVRNQGGSPVHPGHRATYPSWHDYRCGHDHPPGSVGAAGGTSAGPLPQQTNKDCLCTCLTVDELKLNSVVGLARLSKENLGQNQDELITGGLQLASCINLHDFRSALRCAKAGQLNVACYELITIEGTTGIGLYALFLYLHCQQKVGVCQLPSGGKAYIVPLGTDSHWGSSAPLEDRLLVAHVSAASGGENCNSCDTAKNS